MEVKAEIDSTSQSGKENEYEVSTANDTALDSELDLTKAAEIINGDADDELVLAEAESDLLHNDKKASESKHQRSKLRMIQDCHCCRNTFLHRFCPLTGVPERFLLRICAVLLGFATVWSIVGDEMLPGGNLFSLFVLLVVALFCGFLVRLVPQARFPPLLGMLIAGFMLRNIEAINIAQHINKTWSSSLRSMALVVILLRSGLGLDINALKKLKCTVIRLALTPCIVEAITVAVVAHFLLGMPWLWGFQLGFIIGAVSPAVVVPCMLDLQESGYGTGEGIPTLVMAASSCDDVLAISMFGVFLGVAFSTGNLAFNIFRGPIELFMGITIGGLLGLILWFIPNRSNKLAYRHRLVFLLGLGLFAVFASNKAEFAGAGALAVLTLAAVAGVGWGDSAKEPVENGLAIAWTIFQPLLFGLIGAEVRIEYLSGDLVLKGIGTLAVGLLLRLTCTYLVVFGNNLTVKERLFIAIAWLPKATVQAAIGSIPLLIAEERGFSGQFQERVGREIVTLAVLVILITAPIGAIAISLAGPRFLKKEGTKKPTADADIEDQAAIELKS